MSCSQKIKLNENATNEFNDKYSTRNWKYRYLDPKKPNYNKIYFYGKKKKKVDVESDDLFQLRHKLQYTEDRLKQVKENAIGKRKKLNKQWKELEILEKELQEDFEYFDSFIKDNVNKRIRAVHRAREFKIIRIKRTEAIKKIKEDIDKMKKSESNMKSTIASKIFEEYLDKVVEAGNFKSKMEVMNRYFAIEEAREKVAERWENATEIFEVKRDIYEEQLTNFKWTYSKLSTELSNLRKRYDKVRFETCQREVVIANIGHKYGKLAKGLTWSKMALEQLFDLICSRRDRTPEKKETEINKLLQISNILKGLENIEENLKKLCGDGHDISTSMKGICEEKNDADDNLEEDICQQPLVSPQIRTSIKSTKVPTPESKKNSMVTFNKIFAGKKPQKNFADRYRKALTAIREEKSQEAMKEIFYTEDPENVSRRISFDSIRYDKRKLAAAARIIMGLKSSTMSPQKLPKVSSSKSDITNQESTGKNRSNSSQNQGKNSKEKFCPVEPEKDFHKSERTSVTLPDITSDFSDNLPKKKVNERNLDRSFNLLSENANNREVLEQKKQILPPISPTGSQRRDMGV